MKIKFLPTNQEIEGDPNKTLLQLCTENKIEIKSICKGVPSCAECRVKIVEGEYNIVPPTKAEMSLIGTNYFIDQRRLSCQMHCYGDVTVDLTEQIERSEIQSKKIRGFRSPHQKGSAIETHAKQGTMVLDEPAPKLEPTRQPREERGGNPRGGGRNQNKNQNANPNANKSRQIAKGSSGGQADGNKPKQKSEAGSSQKASKPIGPPKPLSAPKPKI